MVTIPHATRSRTRRARAFTIVELLISMAVIVILIGIALYGLRTARRAAARTTTMNALKQIMTAYNSYTTAHDGRLLPGYLNQATLFNLKITAKLRDGTILDDRRASSYVWRLSPYLDHGWQTFMADYQNSDLVNRFESEYAAGVYGPGNGNTTNTHLCISERPSFGLNSIYLGGDTTHGSPNLSPWANFPDPNPGTVAAVRISEVKNPAKIIVFAPTRAIGFKDPEDYTSPVPLGYAHLSPPFVNFNRTAQTPLNRKWMFDPASTAPDSIVFTFTGMFRRGGVPIDRYGGNKVSLGHLDGSVTTELLESLGPKPINLTTPMSRWSPFAVGFQ